MKPNSYVILRTLPRCEVSRQNYNYKGAVINGGLMAKQKVKAALVPSII